MTATAGGHVAIGSTGAWRSKRKRKPAENRRSSPWLLILVSGIYAVSLGGEFDFDDILLIQKEETPDDPGDWARIFAEPTNPFRPYYRPLSRLSYLVQKAVHGNAPLWFHTANALLAGLIAFTAFRLLLRPQFSRSPLRPSSGRRSSPCIR